MKASTILAVASAALVSAAPVIDDTPRANPKELTQITDLSITQATLDNKVKHVYFKLSGRDAKDLVCTADNLPYPERAVYNCGDSKYRFGLHTGTDGHPWSLSIYHELAPAFGWWGVGNIEVNCHSVDTGAETRYCGQYGNATIGLAL
ncbi:hypothetical protein E4U35_000242 [Claviceps purpurea]|uniref:AA1-like domain-containing protein n=1 Tax=Claviceps purpurea (strain 20.1) TaxID=1111077 RepID=M1W9F5_CLAP2|nr:hypothetical protein E4U12_008190 [Claviceps purpurea]CCE32440.1 uncharacterized protein CPUR_06300 [Claviceps purpurea 20.1]KAG6135323.1 hypothetical protein E4U28_005465 [Claviceps purpurea]KAG6143746.1 hypothetical protein E4U38_003637 [Claviceps purpurea]KAG6153696.1 hypothetical protein E4U37_002713 [Claviceps purpurea]